MDKDPVPATPAVSTETQLDLAHDPNNGSITLGLSLQGRQPGHLATSVETCLCSCYRLTFYMVEAFLGHLGARGGHAWLLGEEASERSRRCCLLCRFTATGGY